MRMAHPLMQLAFRLTANGFRFRRLRAAGGVQKPHALSLEVTHRCIARCVMCNIWRIPRDTPVLSAEEWLGLLDRDIFSELVELDVTGGEPFLRADLADMLTGVCDLTSRNLRSLRSIALTTNGFLTRRALAGTRQILAATQAAGIDLILVCAMDAVGPLHDTVRGFPGGWEKLTLTLEGLTALRREFSNLIIGLKTTVLPATVGELDGIADYARRHGFFTIISPLIITEGRYRNPDRARELTFSVEQIQEMIRFFKSNQSQWSFHEKRLVHYLETGRMRKPCSCGFNYCFIRSTGALMPCPMIDAVAGNITVTPIETLLDSATARRIRRYAGRMPECRRCTEPGLERYSLPCEGWTYLSLLPQMGPRRFIKMHRHMGLDKHLPLG